MATVYLFNYFHDLAQPDLTPALCLQYCFADARDPGDLSVSLVTEGSHEIAI